MINYNIIKRGKFKLKRLKYEKSNKRELKESFIFNKN